MTAKGLQQAALNRRQVTGLPWGRSPAAWVCSMSFHFVMGQLPKLKLYKPKKRKEPKEEPESLYDALRSDDHNAA